MKHLLERFTIQQIIRQKKRWKFWIPSLWIFVGIFFSFISIKAFSFTFLLLTVPYPKKMFAFHLWLFHLAFGYTQFLIYLNKDQNQEEKKFPPEWKHTHNINKIGIFIRRVFFSRFFSVFLCVFLRVFKSHRRLKGNSNDTVTRCRNFCELFMFHAYETNKKKQAKWIYRSKHYVWLKYNESQIT